MRLPAGTLDRYVFILLRGRCEIRDAARINARQNKDETEVQKGEGKQFCVGDLEMMKNEKKLFRPDSDHQQRTIIFMPSIETCYMLFTSNFNYDSIFMWSLFPSSFISRVVIGVENFRIP